MLNHLIFYIFSAQNSVYPGKTAVIPTGEYYNISASSMTLIAILLLLVIAIFIIYVLRKYGQYKQQLKAADHALQQLKESQRIKERKAACINTGLLRYMKQQISNTHLNVNYVKYQAHFFDDDHVKDLVHSFYDQSQLISLLSLLDENLAQHRNEVCDLSHFSRRLLATYGPIIKHKSIAFFPNIDDGIRVNIAPYLFEKLLKILIFIAFRNYQVGRKITLDLKKTAPRCELEVYFTGQFTIGALPELNILAEIETADQIRYMVMDKIVRYLDGQLVCSKANHEFSLITIALPLATENQSTVASPMIDYEEIDRDASLLINSKSFQSKAIDQYLEQEKPILLFFSDDKHLTNQLAQSFLYQFDFQSTSINRLEAAETPSALTLAQELIPDIIIFDTIHEHSHRELLKKLKSESTTSHIPIVLLELDSGQNDPRHEYPIDVSLPKPFHQDELRLIIQAQILNRHKVKTAWLEQQKRPHAVSADSLLPPMDPTSTRFMDKVNHFLENNYDDPNLSVETLAQHCALTKRTLQRKLNAISHRKPAEYIRVFRLEKAKEYIKQGQKLSDIYFRVGFNGQSYFSKSFKEHFKMTPSEYAKYLTRH